MAETSTTRDEPTVKRAPLQQPWDAAAEATPRILADGSAVYSGVAFARIAGYRPLVLDLRMPLGASADHPVPVVLYLHGGAYLWGQHTGILFGIDDALLERGVGIASAQYRLLEESVFPAALHDAFAAMRWLTSEGPLLGVDSGRIGALGESAGGHLSAFLGLNSTDPELLGPVGAIGASTTVAAAACWYPVTDFGLFDTFDLPVDLPAIENWPAGIRPSGDPSDQDAARWVSPTRHVASAAVPTLLLHGTADAQVDEEHSRVLAAVLRDAGTEVEYGSVLGAGHVFEGVDPAPIVARTAEFFQRRLTSE